MPRILLFLALVLPSSLVAITFGPEHRVAPAPRETYGVEPWAGVVAPRGNGWVVFTNEPATTYLPVATSQIVATPIDHDGVPHPDEQVMIGKGGVNLRAVATPKGYLLTWTTFSGTSVVPLGPDLAPSGPTVEIHTVIYSLACDDARCAGATGDGSVVIFDFEGHVTATATAIAPSPGAIVAGSGNVFAAAWLDRGKPRLAFINNDGEVIRSTPLSLPSTFSNIALAPHPLGALVVWGTTAAVVRTDGSIAFQTTLPGTGELMVREYAVAGNGSEYLVVIGSLYLSGSSVEGSPTPAHHWTVRLSNTLDLLDSAPRPLARLPFGNLFASIAASGEDFAVAWLHQGTFGQGTRVARIDAAGTARPEDGVIVSPAPSPQTGASLAATPDATLAVWRVTTSQGLTGLRAMRFDAADTPIDAAPLALSEGATGVVTASDGHDFIAVWREPDSFYDPSPPHLTVATIPAGGGEIHKRMLDVDASPLGIGWDGSGYVLGLNAAQKSSVLVRLSRDGGPMWTRQLPLGFISAMAVLPGRTLILGKTNAVYGSDGSLVADVPFIAGDNTAAWSNGRDEFLVTTTRFFDKAYRLFAMRLDANGQRLNGSPNLPGVPVAITDSYARAAALGRRWLLAWTQPSGGMATFPDLETVTGEEPSAITAMAGDGAGGVVILAQRAATQGRWTVSAVVLRRVAEDAVRARRRLISP